MQKKQLSRIVFAATAICAVWAVRATAGDDDLSSLSLEQLMQEPVTSVSKKATRLSEAAAAIAVVSQDDIRRLGITTLPDALRLVPGLDVEQISSNMWAVSSRGFNAQIATKLLVLIDGRSVYSPASGGVFWNAQDIMIEDVDRIEVIRGPGATLWGANAVNGVINVITKRAADSQGTLLSTEEGSDDLARDAARYGGKIGSDTYYRLYAKYLDQGGFEDSTHRVDTGDWRAIQSGFRLDTALDGRNDFTLQGDIYSSNTGESLTTVDLSTLSYRVVDFVDHNNGSNLVARWTHNYAPDSALTVQAFFDHVNQGSVGGTEHRDTYDIDLQHGFRIGTSNDLLWGAGLRSSSIDETVAVPGLTWLPPRNDIHLYNLFVQDELTIVPDKLRLTAGTKLEHSNISGSNLQPNLRLAWMPTDHQTVWAAVSRATRTPALFELHLNVEMASFATPGALPTLVSLVPNPHLLPEQLTAYELGYRFTPLHEVSIDIASFVNRYTHEVTQILGMPQFVPGPVPYILVPFMQQNAAALSSYGIETTAHWQAAQNWELTAGYTFLRIDATSAPVLARESPAQQVQLRSYLDLPRGFQVNAALYYVDSVMEPAGPLTQPIPPFVRGDLGIVWKRGTAWSLGLWGQNLFQHEQVEFATLNTPFMSEVPRSVVGKINWAF